MAVRRFMPPLKQGGVSIRKNCVEHLMLGQRRQERIVKAIQRQPVMRSL